MRSSIIAFFTVAIMVAAAAAFINTKRSAPSFAGSSVGQTGQTAPRTKAEIDSLLTERLRTLSSRAGGIVGVAVIHVETGRAISIEGTRPLPLFSVFKLPLAIAVLKEVEGKRLLLEKKILITPADVAPGSQFNLDLWRKSVERRVQELLEVSIVRSDNTSSDKLLGLIGGPAVVTQWMRQMGFATIDIHTSTRAAAANRSNPNTGSADDLARLLVRLQKGEMLLPANGEMLLDLMRRAKTGEKRLRGNLPPGTPVAEKTGTGEAGSNTNDVGLITLPDGKGHLAVAVLISGSKLPAPAQEMVIAELARAAYDAHLAPVAGDAR
ncbi:MAG TPA: class A beta-lactamase [Pyrinomonadaceae bacterium]|nr:class A beta-lactamase [Pyrinomonadaceae bacterium]